MAGAAGDAGSAGIVAGLLDAYREGYFPMAVPEAAGQGKGSRIEWFNPARRGVIRLEAFHVPGTLRQRVRSGKFRITSDRAFERVIRACAEPVAGSAARRESWIDERIMGAYCELHRAGHAHSVEAWLGGDRPELVGGLYGVHIGGLFAGESMFSRPELGGTDASKVCLVHLVGHLRRRGFVLLDTQFGSPHLKRFGGIEVPRRQYLTELAAAVGMAVLWDPFETEQETR